MKTPTKKRALIYCRVSGTNQEKDGFGLPSQVKANTAHAKQLGYQVVETVEETYSGAYFFERAKLGECREKIRLGYYDAVIIHQVDRLSRQTAHLAIFVDECERAGVELIFVLDKLEDTPEGRLMLSVKGYVAEIERLKIRERTMRGRRAKLESGKLIMPSMSLYGYTTDKETGTRDLVMQEAATVRRIFDWYLTGHSMRAIATYLTEEEIRTPGAGKKQYSAKNFRFQSEAGYLWQHGMVQRILKNIAYAGKTYAMQSEFESSKKNGKRTNVRKTRDQKEWVELPDHITPAIVTEQEFARVQKRLATNVGTETRNIQRPALLRGLIYCQCGEKMSPAWGNPNPSRGRAGYIYFNYRCTSRRGSESCGYRRAQINGTKIEAAVWDNLCSILSQPDRIRSELEARRQQGSGTRQRLEENIASTKKSLAKVEIELARMTERVLLLDDSLFEIVKQQLDSRTKDRNRLRETLEDAQLELDSCEDNVGELEAMELYCKGFKELLPDLSFADKRTLVEFFVKKVIGNKGSTAMVLRIPTSPIVWLELSKTRAENLPSHVTTNKTDVTYAPIQEFSIMVPLGL